MWWFLAMLWAIVAVWVLTAKPDPHADYVHPVEELRMDSGGELFPPGCALVAIPIVLILGAYVLYLFWQARPF